MFASENGLLGDPRLKAISEAIRVVPHFPKPGIMFQDITTLLLNPKAFKYTIDIFVDRYRDMGISVVAGVEARGFLFGPAIALAIGAKFVPLRKPKKLPGPVIYEEYELEYGFDCLEMHVGSVQKGERAVIIDDVVATGGTLSAAIRLNESAERLSNVLVLLGCQPSRDKADLEESRSMFLWSLVNKQNAVCLLGALVETFTNFMRDVIKLSVSSSHEF